MRRVTGVLAALVLACATPGPGPPPHHAGEGLWGYVRLVPRPGVEAGGSGGGGYGDRRLRDVSFVDYQKPGFAVVYVDGRPAPADSLRLVVRDGLSTPRLEPRLAAVGSGGTLTVENRSAAAHTLSAPGWGRIHRLAPGASVRIPAVGRGEHALHLLDAPRASARVFVAPGPYAVASEQGRFELGALDAGRLRLVAWHPRFPESTRWVDVVAGRQRVDLELGVGRDEAQP